MLAMSCLGITHVAASSKGTPNLKYHRDIYQDDNHSLIMYVCIMVANCVCSFNIKAPRFMYPID